MDADLPAKVSVDQLSIEPFRETINVKNFDCGDKDLNEFLTREEVAKYEQARLGKTHLVFWTPGGRLAAYFTISYESLRLEYLKSVKSFSIPGEIRVESVPGIKIGRLAVQNEFRGRDVGTHILRYIAGLALNAPAAARILFLEAYPDSVEFYQKFDFVEVVHHKFKYRRTVLMYFDLMRHEEWTG